MIALATPETIAPRRIFSVSSFPRPCRDTRISPAGTSICTRRNVSLIGSPARPHPAASRRRPTPSRGGCSKNHSAASTRFFFPPAPRSASTGFKTPRYNFASLARSPQAAPISPPLSPLSGPRSMIQSAVLMTSRLSSMTTRSCRCRPARAAPQRALPCR
jgi:hypothetical protein